MADPQDKKQNASTESRQEATRVDFDKATRELTAAYERARQELQAATDRLRRELDQIDVQQAKARTQDWVRDNPALAAALAVGAGVLAGTLLARAFRTPPPPSLKDRARLQAQMLLSEARHRAGDAGAYLARQTVRAGDEFAQRSRVLGASATRTAGEVGDTLTHSASELASTLSESAERLGESVAAGTLRAAHSIQSAADSLSEAARARHHRGSDVARSLTDAARTAGAVLAVQRLSRWIRRS